MQFLDFYNCYINDKNLLFRWKPPPCPYVTMCAGLWFENINSVVHRAFPSKMLYPSVFQLASISSKLSIFYWLISLQKSGKFAKKNSDRKTMVHWKKNTLCNYICCIFWYIIKIEATLFQLLILNNKQYIEGHECINQDWDKIFNPYKLGIEIFGQVFKK